MSEPLAPRLRTILEQIREEGVFPALRARRIERIKEIAKEKVLAERKALAELEAQERKRETAIYGMLNGEPIGWEEPAIEEVAETVTKKTIAVEL